MTGFEEFTTAHACGYGPSRDGDANRGLSGDPLRALNAEVSTGYGPDRRLETFSFDGLGAVVVVHHNEAPDQPVPSALTGGSQGIIAGTI